MTHSPTPTELLALKTANAALLTRDSSYDFAATIVFALGSAQLLQSPETAAELVRLRARVAELEAERHVTNEALSDAAERMRQDRDRIAELEAQVAAVDDLRIRAIDKGDQLRARVDEIERKYTFDTAKLRARVAELEAAAEQVAEFCAQRAEYVTNLRAFVEGGEHDYYRWTGHAEARRQLSQRLGLPVGWPAEDLPVVPTTAAPVEDAHDSPLHHTYRVGRDLPPCGTDLGRSYVCLRPAGHSGDCEPTPDPVQEASRA
ncbi:hypothetical protein ACIGD1_11500 [Streptomyces sp. NPDC085612]|uniref:hypothetical protein n=1 Tax=Streptomyces sp. NPDC085612 TaxID=3365732 RepID=UPI0037D4EB9F